MALTKATFSMIDGAYVNVMDYGVTGDGSTNDTQAIQDVLNDFAGINTVFFPAGTYMVAGDAILPGNVQKRGIQIPSDSNLVFADGAVLQLITTTATTYNVLCVYNVSNVKITGGHLIGDTANHPPGTLGSEFNGIGLRIQGATNVYVNGMAVEKMYADGFAIVYDDETSPYPECKNIVLENCTSTYNYRNGLSTIGCKTGAVIGGNYSYNGQATQAEIGCGIDVEPNAASGTPTTKHYVTNYSITGAVFDHNRTTGILVYGAGTPPNDAVVQNLIIQNNRCTNNGTHISTHNALDVVIANNTCDTSTVGYGIILQHTRNSVCTGNTIYNSHLGGIGLNNWAYATNGTQNIVVSNNVVYDNGTNGIDASSTFDPIVDVVISNNLIHSNQENGIYLSEVEKFNVTNNIAYSNSQEVDATFMNILLETCVFTSVEGNKVYKGALTNKPLYNISSDSGSNIVVSDNQTDDIYSVSTSWVDVYHYVTSNAFADTINVTVYGSDGTNAFQDELVFGSASGATVVVLSSSTIKGTPAARTYNTGVHADALSMDMASGTYTVRTYGTER